MNGREHQSVWNVGVCGPAERAEALALLLSDCPPEERSRYIERFFAESGTGSFHGNGLFLCRGERGPIGVLFCMESPGRTMVLWTPKLAPPLSPDQQRDVQDRLLRAMAEFARERNARLVQALLADNERALGPLLVRNGFFYLTRLMYLNRVVGGRLLPPPPAGLEYVPYSAQRHRDFREVVGRSYEQTLDCPELNGARELEEVLEGHRAHGEFEASRWWLARQAGAWVGCLLLARLAEYNALEIVYVAVLPEARGNGLGGELVRQTFREAARAGIELVTLAVDVRNLPARTMYQTAGFELWDERDVYLLMLDPADGKLDRKGSGPARK